ncbi:MAG: endo-1,4-beta-xylanase, partial [Planctomycetota bacterium]
MQNPPGAQNWVIGGTGRITHETRFGPQPPGTFSEHGSPIDFQDPANPTNSLFIAQRKQHDADPNAVRREYVYGDFDLGEFDGAGSVDALYNETVWNNALSAIAGGAALTSMDDFAAGQIASFSAPFDLADERAVSHAVLTLGVRGSGDDTSDSVLHLEDVGNVRSLASLGVQHPLPDDATTVITLQLTGYDLAALEDGRLNLATAGNVGIDWVVLDVTTTDSQPTLVQTLPYGGIVYADGNDADDFTLIDGQSVATHHVVSVVDDALPFDEAVRVHVSQLPSQPWSVQVRLPSTGQWEAGDVGLLNMFVRGSAVGGGETDLRAYLELDQSPFTKFVSTNINVDSAQWTQVMVPFQFATDQDAYRFTMHSGATLQNFEIGGLQLLNYNTLYRQSDLPVTGDTDKTFSWRDAADARINAIRKSDVDLTIVDENGDPIDGADVRIQQKRHAFGFGNLIHAKWIGITEEEFNAQPAWANQEGYTWQDVLNFRQQVEENYNLVVFGNDMKWRPWEVGKTNTQWNFRQSWLDRSLQWAAERGIEVRGHAGAWGHINGENEFNHNNDTSDGLDQRTLDHIAEKVAAVGQRVTQWDAVNHPVGWTGFQNTTEFRYGADHHADLFHAVADAAPHAAMWANEFRILHSATNADAYAAYIQRMLDRDAPVDGIGFQGHFQSNAGSVRPIEDIYQTMERFASIIPNLQITELDYETSNNQAQADFIGDLMRASFSHASMQSIIHWGFWEGRHWRPDGAHFNRDWTIKPVGQVIDQLVFDEWWTDETIESTSQGNAFLRSFHGEYDIVVTHNGISKTYARSVPASGLTEQLMFSEVTLNPPNISLPLISESGGSSTVTLQISAPLTTATTFNIGLAGEAVPDQDYSISSTMVEIPAGETSASFSLTGINNDIVDGSRSVEL